MRFHLIDRIDELEPRVRVRGRKVTSVGEEHWDDRGDGPRMPPPLVLEALCQAGTWLIMASTDRRQRAALLQVGSVRFLGDVRPGDVIELTGEVVSMTDEIAVLSGRAEVDGSAVLEAEDIMCALIDADDLEGAEESARMLDMLTRAGGG
jgi:3-hydroxyacyl-[acyl-carrier-protein] dehydratase